MNDPGHKIQGARPRRSVERPAGPSSRLQHDFVIKVCGITKLEDAVLSVKAGANALGFNFYPGSPRFIEPAEAAKIIEELPKPTLNIGVVVIQPSLAGASQERLEGGECVLGELGLNTRDLIRAGFGAIQIHGASEERQIPDLGIRTFVATSPQAAGEFSDYEIVIDTSWGSGTVADWDLILRLLDRPYILSGGLTPANVEEALQKLHPDGVDVCSGVEEVPGTKNREKLERFLAIVRRFADDFRSNSRSKES